MSYKVNYETREGRTHNAFFDDLDDAQEFMLVRKDNFPELYCSKVMEVV